MLRGIVIFLVGAGVMLGAFLTGLAQRVPAYFAHGSDFSSSPTIVDGSEPLLPADGRSPDNLIVPAGAPESGQIAPDHVYALRISANGYSQDCAPSYEFSNATDRPVIFAPAEEDQAGIMVAPNSSFSSETSDDAASCGPPIRIQLQRGSE